MAKANHHQVGVALRQLLDDRLARLAAAHRDRHRFAGEAVHELGHATPESVHNAVRERAAGVNITTVYRTLELLEELGLVNHTHLSHGSPTYHPAGEDQHVHLVCRSCGSIAEVDPDVMLPVTTQLRDEHGFRVDVGHVSLFGICGDCKESE